MRASTAKRYGRCNWLAINLGLQISLIHRDRKGCAICRPRKSESLFILVTPARFDLTLTGMKLKSIPPEAVSNAA